MQQLDLIFALSRELVLPHPLPRVPEPEMVMDESEQVAAYADSGRLGDGIMAASNPFHSARVSQVIVGSRVVLDLGCRPATQLAQIARLNPGVRFVGTELSPRMLDNGRAHLRDLGIENAELVKDDITMLETVGDQSVDGAISTMTLHHLPREEDLRACLRQIRRVLKPGGAIYLADFGRLKSVKSVHFVAHVHEDTLPAVVVQDYMHSLRAAFSVDEYRRLVREELLPDAKMFKTFGMPVMIAVKTADRPVPPDLKVRLGTLRNALSPRFRAELDNLRLFFRLGGLANDPF